jgi:hypothetical protein
MALFTGLFTFLVVVVLLNDEADLIAHLYASYILRLALTSITSLEAGSCQSLAAQCVIVCS